MKLTKNNLQDIGKAFNDLKGIVMDNVPEVRNAVANHAKNIVDKIHARENGVTLKTYLANKAFFVDRATKGIYGVEAMIWKITDEVKIGETVLVRSVKGDIDLGHDVNYKMAKVEGNPEENVYTVDGCDYLVTSIVKLK